MVFKTFLVSFLSFVVQAYQFQLSIYINFQIYVSHWWPNELIFYKHLTSKD